jgi:Xaa-Pro aminopeptidase
MSTPVDFCKKRYAYLKQLMAEKELDLVWLYGGAGMGPRFKRIADTTSGLALLIPLDGEPALYVYGVDYNSAVEESWLPVKLIEGRAQAGEKVTGYANQHLREGSKIGCNMDSLTINSYEYYKNNMKGELVDISGTLIPEVFFGLYPEEIEFHRKVSKLADIGCTAAREAMSPGAKETDIAAEANYAMQRHGAETYSFQTIVSTGPRSAYSHGYPTPRELREGEFMLVDLGPTVDSYAADETRTFIMGKDPKKQKMLEAMDKAVQAVIDHVKPGASCMELDAISRRVLKEHGFPDYPHSLGHPLSGFPTPILSKNSLDTLKPGMLFTVEPGIYIPGYGGVRMEENVVVTENGCEQLTKSPRLIT